jgi:dTDP-glucose 4,6-dehydratase
MRVLLSGAGGFVGHHTLAHVLEKTDWQIVVTDSFRHKGLTSRINGVLSELDTNARSRVTLVTHDLTVPIDAILGREIGKIDVIISMASESHVDRSIENPRPFIENNIGILLTLLEFARNQRDLKLFLQVSTDEVYGPAQGATRHREWDPYFPSNPYSASKASQETLCFAYWRTYGLPMVITNTMNIIGERQDPEKFLPKIIRAIRSDESVNVHAQEISEGHWKSSSRFYLHARSQSDALVYLINHLERLNLFYNQANSIPEKFHIVGEKEYENDQLVNFVAQVMGKKAKIQFEAFHASRPGHDMRYALDGEKLANFGWKHPENIENSISRTVNWFLANPYWLTI